MTHPKEPAVGSETPLTDAQVVTGQVCEDFRDAKGKMVTQVKYEMNKEWVFADHARTLELALRRRDALLRRWINKPFQVNDKYLLEDTERELGNAARKEGADRE